MQHTSFQPPGSSNRLRYGKGTACQVFTIQTQIVW